MGNPSILIVDDEACIRLALERWLRLRGFDVDVAEDGDVAIEKCRSRKYDVITMDLEMPRMNGVAAMAEIKRLRPNVPIVVFTGYPHELREVLISGATKVLVKPLRLREFESEIRDILAKSQSRSARDGDEAAAS